MVATEEIEAAYLLVEHWIDRDGRERDDGPAAPADGDAHTSMRTLG